MACGPDDSGTPDSGPDHERCAFSFAILMDTHSLEDRIAAFFGGHLHLDSEQSGPTGIPVVLTAATKDGHGPRVVQVSELGELGWD